jgi:hypothetical protein
MARGKQILSDLESSSPTTATPDRLRSFPIIGSPGYTSVYAILKYPKARSERESVAWGIYLDSQHRFEEWQGSGWVSPATEGLRGSSYANEDLPSDYLGFYAAARYPDLSPAVAIKVVARQLGGGAWDDEPKHAGHVGNVPLLVGFAKPLIVTVVTTPIYWGDPNLKNYSSTPRVYGNGSWYNKPWPAELYITPMGNGTYWQYQGSYNTFYR